MPDGKIIDSAKLFGPFMRSMRRSQNITVQRMVERLDISRQTVTRFEKGQHDMRLSQIIEACDLMGLEVVLREKSDAEPQ